MAIAMARDKHYMNKTLRISDEVWKEMKDKRRKSKLSWNLFIKQLIEKNEDSK